MARQTIWPSEIPNEVIFLTQERDDVKDLSAWTFASLGASGASFWGLECTPGSGLTVALGQGGLIQYAAIDPTAWSSLAADPSEWMLQARNDLASLVVSGFPAPSISGDSINYLIEGQVQVTDATAVSLNFTNGQNPPSAVAQSKSPYRYNLLAIQVKAGTAAATGTQVTPTPDSGWVPLWQVQVDYGDTSIPSGNISFAPNAPVFYGFVRINPLGNTPVYLNPVSQQSGGINISGEAQVGGIKGAYAYINAAAPAAPFASAFSGGFTGDFLSLSVSGGWTGSAQATDSLDISGSIGYLGSHAGTDADPYPLSQLNVAMFGNKLPSDYALAGGNYITLYAGTPTVGVGNAAISGSFQADHFLSQTVSGAPITCQSTVQCPNLNAEYLGGYVPGNASGNIPISNGTLCSNLNAAYLGGQPSAYYQPAGSYAVMNVTNTGNLTVTGTVATTGGLGSSQGILQYLASNTFGIISGGAIVALQSSSVPLALIGSSIRTNAPLYVGDSTRQTLYAGDLWPTGILRAGTCVYTVTLGQSGNSYPYPGNGTAMGTWESATGQFCIATATTSASGFYMGYRVKITLSASLAVTFNTIGYGSMFVYVDGVLLTTLTTGIGSFPTTLTQGTHTLDFIVRSRPMGDAYYLGNEGLAQPDGSSWTMYGWIPRASDGSLSSTITALVPG